MHPSVRTSQYHPKVLRTVAVCCRPTKRNSDLKHTIIRFCSSAFVTMASMLMATSAVSSDMEILPRFQITGFADAPLEGSTRNSTLFSGRVDGFLTVKNIWDGATLNAHFEYVDGDDALDPRQTGLIWPRNILAALPRSISSNNAGLSLTLSQKLSDSVSLTAGKFNVVELADKAPISGGRGQGGFLYTGIAAPPSFVFPPYVLGAQLSVATKKVNYSMFIYDANNASGEDYWEDIFNDGVTFNATATYKANFGGLPGFYSANAIYSTKDGTDFTSGEDINGTIDFIARTSGVGFAALKFQQFLSQAADDPSKGWGLFGQIGIGTDGNEIDQQFILGLAGNSPISGRSDDRWGIAGSRFNWSNGIEDTIELNGPGIQDEWAVEAFYEAKVNDVFRVGVNAMYVQPTLPEFDDLVQIGIRIRATF